MFYRIATFPKIRIFHIGIRNGSELISVSVDLWCWDSIKIQIKKMFLCFLVDFKPLSIKKYQCLTVLWLFGILCKQIIIKYNSNLKCCDAKCDNTMNEFSLAVNSYSMTRFNVTQLKLNLQGLLHSIVKRTKKSWVFLLSLRFGLRTFSQKVNHKMQKFLLHA